MLRCGVHSLVIGSGTGVVRVVRLVRVFRVLMLGIAWHYQTISNETRDEAAIRRWLKPNSRSPNLRCS